MPAFDCTKIETLPGKENESAFSPPENWSGDSRAYFELMRERFKDRVLVQRIYFAASCFRKQISIVTGPFDQEATTIINAINNRLVAKLAE